MKWLVCLKHKTQRAASTLVHEGPRNEINAFIHEVMGPNWDSKWELEALHNSPPIDGVRYTLKHKLNVEKQ